MRDFYAYTEDVARILTTFDPLAQNLFQPIRRVRDDFAGDVSLGIRFSDGSRLYVRIEVDCSGNFVRWDNYGLQYLAPDGSVRFRFDNAPHHHDLANFPLHLHIGQGGSHAVFPQGSPRIRTVARAIRWCMAHPDQPLDPGMF